jgi:hypothetical protein
VAFWTQQSREQLEEDVLAIPGVQWQPGAVTAAWDIAWKVGELLGIEVPPAPTDGPITLPGLDRYYELGFHKILREYQKAATLYLTRRGGAMLCLPCRTGKCLVSLAADILVGSRATLIAAPSIVKWVWAEEIAKWTGEAALILEGRGGREARRYCLTCNARGTLPDGNWCPDCKQFNGQSYGYNIIEVRTVSRPVRAPSVDLPKPRKSRRRRRKAGSAMRLNLIPTDRVVGPPYPTAYQIEKMREVLKAYLAELDEGQYCCTRHPEVRSDDPKLLCVTCREELLAALCEARYVVCNYDILTSQDAHSEEGRLLGARLDLPGWAPVLSRLEFDVAILDECHVFRGRPQKKRKGRTRQDRLRYTLRGVSRVWGPTGTPVFGYVRDLYMQVDVITDGLFGRPWYLWDARYCEGHHGPYGWVSTGRGVLAETELRQRLWYFMHKRERSEILSELPAKSRQVVRVEPKAKLVAPMANGDRRGAISRALGSTLEHKIDEIIENVVGEVAEGNKVIVFCLLHASVERVYAALDKAFRAPNVAPRIRKVNAQLWLTHGAVADSKARFDLARDFRDHQGGGAFVSTIDAMQVGISLRGAASVHFAELHWSPAAIDQAESRPYEPGTTGLSVVYYIVKGSIDEHIESVILSKLETQILLVEEEGAKEVKTALSGSSEEESMEEIWRRLTAHIDSEISRD